MALRLWTLSLAHRTVQLSGSGETGLLVRLCNENTYTGAYAREASNENVQTRMLEARALSLLVYGTSSPTL